MFDNKLRILITELIYQKCCNENMLEIYPYLRSRKATLSPTLLQDQDRRKRIAHDIESRSIEKEGNVTDIKYKTILVNV